MMKEQCGMSGHEHTNLCLLKRISWTAILVGALVAVGLGFLLNLFSIAIGLSLVTTNPEGMKSLAIGGYLGIVIGTIATMFTAGWAAGYLGRPFCLRRNLGVIYGFSAWCIALILTVLLAAHMGRYVGFYTDFVSQPGSVHMMKMEKPMMQVEANVVATKSDKAETKSAVTPSTEKAANALGITSLLIFTLFFIGALSACFGGHCGMYSCKDDDSCA